MRRYGWRASPSACAAITPAPTASSPPPPAWPVKLRSPRPRYKSFAARSPIFRLPGSRTKYRSSRTRTGSTTWKASVAPAWVSVGLGSRSGSMSVLGLGCVKTPTFNLRVEIPSRFRKFENQKCLRPLLRADDRENNSAHSWLVHVFTQPGSSADLKQRTFDVRSSLDSVAKVPKCSATNFPRKDETSDNRRSVCPQACHRSLL